MTNAGLKNLPKASGYINDYASVLQTSHKSTLTNLLQELEQKTKVQIAVATIKSIEPYEIEEYANNLFNEWKIGYKGQDNGILIIMALQERKVRIETGYAIEGIISDGTAGAVLDQYILPSFRKGDYSTGLYMGALAVSHIVAKANNITLSGMPKIQRQNSRRARQRSNPFGLVIWLIIIASMLGRSPRGLSSLLFLSMFLGGPGNYRSSYNSSLGGGFGGFGGGFGGFGGGMSGGGGASRGW